MHKQGGGGGGSSAIFLKMLECLCKGHWVIYFVWLAMLKWYSLILYEAIFSPLCFCVLQVSFHKGRMKCAPVQTAIKVGTFQIFPYDMPQLHVA